MLFFHASVPARFPKNKKGTVIPLGNIRTHDCAFNLWAQSPTRQGSRKLYCGPFTTIIGTLKLFFSDFFDFASFGGARISRKHANARAFEYVSGFMKWAT
jgi:hypothetical protein